MSQSNLPQYYRPYDSDQNDDFSSASDSDSDDSSSTSSVSEVDPRYEILKLSGPSLHQNQNQVRYYYDQEKGSPYDPETNITSFEDHVYLDPPKTIKTTLVSVKSISRDKSVWPTPYRFQIKLPRVYKNVTKFQMVQMSFPNNNTNNISQAALISSAISKQLLLDGVPSSCISDCVGVLNCTTVGNSVGLIEEGRINSYGEPLLVTLPVNDGTYDDLQLAKEITFRANSTPPFNLISYEEFRDVFMNTRDIMCLFNEPGDGFVSQTAPHKRFGQHNKLDIMGTYYSQYQLDCCPVITEKIAIIAYYFPILKELCATQMAEPFLRMPPGITYSAASGRILGIFEGFQSDFYETMCILNQGTLDAYRCNLTFQLRNINKYVIHYNEASRNYHVIHDSIHPSIQRDLSRRHQMILSQHLQLAQLHSDSFRSLQSEWSTQKAILRHLETHLSTVLGQSRFVTDYRYTGGNFHSTLDAIQDLDADPSFTTLFSFTSSIGGLYGTFSGIRMQFTRFSEYHSTLSSYYQLVQHGGSVISSVHGGVDRDYHRYVSTKYNRILPAKMIESRSYALSQGVPVTFVQGESVYFPGMNLMAQNLMAQNLMAYNQQSCLSICCAKVRSLLQNWYSNLPATFVARTLAYRLGVHSINPSSINITSTIMSLTSTGNLNYLMQINDEQGFNNMDISMPENYMMSNETTGQVKLFCAKILMGAPGDTGSSQTVIQNPSIFDNTLGKLDRLDIKIFYDDQEITPAWEYLPYYLTLSEWNATFQIDEEMGYANRASGWGAKPTVPIPTDPDKTPYLFVTHRDNPNNS